MVDRKELREKAKSIGSSVAGTFKSAGQKAKAGASSVAETTKQGASNIKNDLSGGDSTVGIAVKYDRQADEYVVFADGKPFTTYDSRDKATQAARAAIRDRQRSLNDTAEAAETSDEAGRFQQFATSFAEGVNQTVSGAMDGEESEAAESAESGDERGDGPTLPMMGGATGSDDNSPQMPFMNGDGDADNDGQGPTLPGFGSTGESSGDAPMLPGFDSESDGEPMLPGFGNNESDEQQPTLPGFGMDDSEETSDEERYPWMF